MKLSDSNRKLKTSNAKIGNQKKYNKKDSTIFDRTGDDRSSLLINDNSTWIDIGTKAVIIIHMFCVPCMTETYTNY